MRLNQRPQKKTRAGYSLQRNVQSDITDLGYGSGPVMVVNEYDPADFSQAGSPAIHQRIRQDRDVFIEGDITVRTFRNYAKGRHRVVLTDKQKQIVRNLLGNKFCDNICAQVLESSSSRLDVQRLQCENKVTGKWLEDWFVSSGMKPKARKVHFAGLRDGNTVLALNWSKKQKDVCLYPEEWWDGYEGVFVAYDDEGNIVYGVKEWAVRTSGVNGQNGIAKRRNIWFPDRLERWTGNGVEWKPYSLPSDVDLAGNILWPYPWLDDAGEPLGVPYVHFANVGRGEMTYGVSDIRDAVGFNDQLNDLQFGMSVAGRLTAYQMYFASGVSDVGEDGKKVEYEVGPAKIWTSPKPESRMTALAAGDLSQLISLYDKKQSTVAIRTRTPMYEITSDTPAGSGEALYQAAQPAIAKAQEGIDNWSPQWTQVAYLAVRIHNAFSGETALAADKKDAMISAVMSPADRRDKLTISVIITNLGDVISNREALRLLGYSPEQIDSIMEERDEEAKQGAINAMTAFSRGTGTGTQLPGTGPDKGPQGGIGPKNPEPGADRNSKV